MNNNLCQFLFYFQEYLDLDPLDSPVSSGASDSQYSSMSVSSAGSSHSVLELTESPV